MFLTKVNPNSSNQLRDLFLKRPVMKFKKRETLIRADDDPAGVYLLEEGFVKMNSVSPDGLDLTLNIFKPGSFFPVIWAIGDIINTYNFQAMTEIKVYKANKNEVINLLQANPEILYDLTKRIIRGLDGVTSNIQHLLFGNSLNRVSSALLICVKRFGEKQGDGRVIIKLPLTHQDIADIAGLARETTSLAIELLQKRQILFQDNHEFIINDLNQLENESSAKFSELESPQTI